MPLFMAIQIKICGLTSVQDVRAVIATGADAIGINFYAKSPRFVEPRDAQHLIAAAGASLIKVGVFVNADVETVSGIYDALGLDLIQLHGDEPPDYIGDLGVRPVMRAFRVDERGLAPVAEYLQACGRLGKMPKAVLLDAYRPAQFGGTGDAADWDLIRREKPLLNAVLTGHVPIVLAGGLTPDNVAEAIAAAAPDAVDTASGVESSPGKKDPELVRRFVETARRAYLDPAAPIT
jgi:phosphoribosylanthranilate isomerase